MSNKSLVSIIVNCFNGEKYLEECLNSIINQTYQNWELIFWDNRSTDNSKKIFEKFKDNRFKYYLSPKHTFLYEARDLAIKESKGEFIAFCDVDDFWSKEKLEYLMPLFSNKKVGIAYSNVWLFNEVDKSKKKYIKNKLPTGNLRSHIIKEPVVTILAAIIRKSDYYNLEIGFNKNYQIIGDFDFFIRISKNITFECTQEPLVFYRLHEGNFTKKNREIEVQELESWFLEMKNTRSFFSEDELNLISEQILYKKIMILILKRNFFSSVLNIIKFPNRVKKIKLFIALLIPNFILRRIKEF